MSYQEKSCYVSLFSTIVVFVSYYMYVSKLFQEAAYSLTESFSFWASAILILIPVQIVFMIVIHIIFIIINKIATNEDDPGFTDELDKLIELKSIRNAYYTFLSGFMLSMASLALDGPPLKMIHIMFFAWMAAAISWDLSRIFFYRRGI